MPRSTLSRRTMLRLGVAAGAAVAAPSLVGVAASRRGLGPSASPPIPTFAVPLPIPPVLAPESTAGGVDRFTIRQVPVEAEILPGLRTRLMTYGGSFPGPTVETRRGRDAVVRHVNELDVPTVAHLHGGITAPEHDGYPTDLLLPERFAASASMHRRGAVMRGGRDHEYPLGQQAATLWYHDHRMHFAGPQVYRGLAGFHLHRDEVEDALPLPRGERELPLMICDRIFAEDGSLYYPSLDPSLTGQPGVYPAYADGVRGDVILVNGAPWPVAEVDAVRYRLRILNASNARHYRLALDPPPPGGNGFVQVGSDIGLLEHPVALDEIPVSAAERYDVVVDFGRYRPGTRVRLVNLGATGGPAQVMAFDVARPAREEHTVPDVLNPGLEPPRAGDAVAERSFSFIGGFAGLPPTINSRTFELHRIDARPALGSTEIWTITSDPAHPVHLHLGHFQVLDRDGEPPPPHETGIKDTVHAAGGQIRLAVRFSGFRGKYVFHCHNQEHGDMGMMSNLEVV
ncbi:MAG: multicopper oxidase domain-containing protein [Pseudonocardiaceae bacterium]|nr:multicopper oxidase domain-containing protein [Pseudonocardiaceae bacterium]